ncbi:tRNA-uridine aminocarboxypropyltransferase [Bordetella sp. 02P26C-1]|uniref:tRNA-uridine aminocarboxypropyltransferase n=1 Tax=Bordetella sp. 02P26C-1 TaxID=2683195 RepID=UPI0013528157|nr:DTW domain-containing protein [Bordetella sp. 02P26C-1]MVW80099.1 DTW domain-containing protein [Bordetella sp. 02P26C-1]
MCERCQRPATHCLCSLIPALDSRTRVVVLQHPDESRHALNTARLAVLGLKNAQLHVGTEFDSALWQVEGYCPRLLFPGEAATVLTRDSAIEYACDPTLLVVPDGTWRHARQLLSHHPALAALPRVTLPVGTLTRYRIRHAEDASALSTIEAIALSLNALESTQNFDALLAPFDALIAAQIAAMGQERYLKHHVLREGSRARIQHEE